MIALTHALRRRAIALVAVLAALGVVGGVVAVNSSTPKHDDATCGYVLQFDGFGYTRVWRCWPAGGGGGGAW